MTYQLQCQIQQLRSPASKLSSCSCDSRSRFSLEGKSPIKGHANHEPRPPRLFPLEPKKSSRD
eukprot:6210918-Pleurochrysis_carterae.AAC.4